MYICPSVRPCICTTVPLCFCKDNKIFEATVTAIAATAENSKHCHFHGAHTMFCVPTILKPGIAKKGYMKSEANVLAVGTCATYLCVLFACSPVSGWAYLYDSSIRPV